MNNIFVIFLALSMASGFLAFLKPRMQWTLLCILCIIIWFLDGLAGGLSLESLQLPALTLAVFCLLPLIHKGGAP